MIHITRDISIHESEIEVEFVRSSGPGGQNVNKVATAVQIRFDVLNSPSLPDEVRERLIRLVGKRITMDGILIITARRHRTQEQNRRDGVKRLVEWIRKASARPQIRIKTAPSPASKKRRLEIKRFQSRKKQFRRLSEKTEDL
jgi:ribosome-associated protein